MIPHCAPVCPVSCSFQCEHNSTDLQWVQEAAQQNEAKFLIQKKNISYRSRWIPSYSPILPPEDDGKWALLEEENLKESVPEVNGCDIKEEKENVVGMMEDDSDPCDEEDGAPNRFDDGADVEEPPWKLNLLGRAEDGLELEAVGKWEDAGKDVWLWEEYRCCVSGAWTVFLWEFWKLKLGDDGLGR